MGSASSQTLRRVLEDEIIEKDAEAEQVALNLRQFGFLPDFVPSVLHGADLPGNDVLRRRPTELEIGRDLRAGRKCARAFATDSQHRRSGLTAETALRADFAGRRLCKLLAVPEGRRIAGVIIGVAAQDVECEPSVQFVPCGPRRGEAVPDDFREVFIAGRAQHRSIDKWRSGIAVSGTNRRSPTTATASKAAPMEEPIAPFSMRCTRPCAIPARSAASATVTFRSIRALRITSRHALRLRGDGCPVRVSP